MTPQLWLIAGPNGSGKSTLTGRYLADRLDVIDPDKIARKADPSGNWTPAGALRAGRQALAQQHACLDAKKSFAVETTLSGHHELDLMRQAKAAGFKVNLVFIGMESPDHSTLRVKERVAAGGHHIPAADIERRYPRSLANLPQAVAIADRAWLLDNTGRRPRLVASLERHQVKGVSQDMPKWARAAKVPALQQEFGLSR